MARDPREEITCTNLAEIREGVQERIELKEHHGLSCRRHFDVLDANGFNAVQGREMVIEGRWTMNVKIGESY